MFRVGPVPADALRLCRRFSRFSAVAAANIGKSLTAIFPLRWIKMRLGMNTEIERRRSLALSLKLERCG